MNNGNEFAGKTVLITGGSSGIGLAASRAFLGAGAKIGILGRNARRLDAAKDVLKQVQIEGTAGRVDGTIFTIVADVSKPEECRSAISAVVEHFGRLDVLVNSAGIYGTEPSRNVTEEVWDTIIDTNLKGTFFMCRYAIPELEKTGGCIVNIASDSGTTGNDEAAVYCASKAGVVLLTKSMAVELVRTGIRVNAVCPGIVETPMVDRDFAESGLSGREEYNLLNLRPYPEGTKRFIEPEEVAHSVLFLASQKRSAATTGVCLPVDFGLTAGY